MITGIDHVVILTDDLPAAMPRFVELGFAVERGGSHPAWGTENALIALADGSYLELLAAREPRLAAQHRLWRRPDGSVRTPGEYGGYALSSDNLADDVASIRRRGLPLADPQDGARQRPDGQMTKWRLAFAQRPDLPFLIEDETPRQVRIAPPPHGLGVDAAIDEVVIQVGEGSDAAAAYGQLLNLPRSGGSHALGRPSVQFTTPRGRITLIHELDGETATGDRRPANPGVFAVVLEVRRWTAHAQAIQRLLRPAGALQQIDPAAAGGVRLFVRPAPS